MVGANAGAAVAACPPVMVPVLCSPRHGDERTIAAAATAAAAAAGAAGIDCITPFPPLPPLIGAALLSDGRAGAVAGEAVATVAAAAERLSRRPPVGPG